MIESSRFRTLTISDPHYERDHLRHVTVKSRALKGRGDITLFVPPGLDDLRKVPLVILLHGVYGSHWDWAYKGGVHHTALRLIEAGQLAPMVLAMPSDGLRGDGTAYLPTAAYDAEQWIVEEVPAAVEEIVSSVEQDSPLFIGGLSMGGFGALRLGAKYADRFKAISAHSSITHLRELLPFVEEPLEEQSTVPDEHSVLDMMKRSADKLLPLRFDCGLQDGLLAFNRRLHQGLLEADIRHTYEELPGDHNWDYWAVHVESTLRFFQAALES